MHWIITISLSIWTLIIGSKVSFSHWDTFVLMGWMTWPLYLCSVLAFAKHRGQDSPFWKLRNLGDYLLLGAYLPLAIGIANYNIALDARLEIQDMPFEENLLFVGYYTVKLWLATAISVFVFYLASRFFLKRKTLDN